MLDSLHPESTPNIHHLSLESPENEFNVEKELNLREQYQKQVEILRTNSLLETLSSGELGIKAINNQDYPLPTYDQVKASLESESKLLENKTKQGFKKLLIVPFGRKLPQLTDAYGWALLRHDEADKLFRAKLHPQDSEEREALANIPVWQWSGYNNADIENKIVYDVHSFSEDHQGKTKTELLTTQGGWQIILIEERPDIPRQDQGETIHNRAQLEAGKTPNEYLHLLQTDPTYKGESGLTPEAWLTLALTRLEETNQVFDDSLDKRGSVAYLTGAYFPSSGDVPLAYWRGDLSQATLGGDDPSLSEDHKGLRSSVRIPVRSLDLQSSSSLFSSTSSSIPPLPTTRKF